MQTPDLTKCPAVDPQDDAQIAALLPEPIRFMPGWLAASAASIGQTLKPGDDWAPHAFPFGWDASGPSIFSMALDGRFYRDGASKHQLAVSLAETVLKRRMHGIETCAVAMVQMAFMASAALPTSDLHILRASIADADENGLKNEPAKIELLLIEIDYQDGQLILGAPVTRSETEPPTLGTWRNLSAGVTMVRNRFWHTVAPTLCAMAYAEAMLDQFSGETGEGDQP